MNPSTEACRTPAPNLARSREDLGPHRIAAPATPGEEAAGSEGQVTLAPERWERAKTAYATRRIPREAMATLLAGDRAPRPGDLVLARVERLRQHKRLELASGRRANLFPGDEVLVCFGNRYAPDQFEAEVPRDLSLCHLVAAGGVAARMLSRHGAVRAATEIQPLGLVGDERGAPLNLADWALPAVMRSPRRPLTVAVAGTSMNAGKTTTAASLIRGLSRAGMKVGAAKVTGTGAGGDFWQMTDAGAAPVLDFTDAGFASTYRVPVERVEGILRDLTAHLALAGVAAIVLEVADGLFQEETAALLRSASFFALVDAVVFAAGDALGAVAGLQWLQHQRLPVVALSGCLTRSPLAMREAQWATGMPVLDSEALASRGVLELLTTARGGAEPRTAPMDAAPRDAAAAAQG